ncbi:THUMP domain-containing protein [Caldiplasma sukawensis]
MDCKGNTNIGWSEIMKYMYLIRYSEIGLKGKKTRAQMESKLIKNIRLALTKYGINWEFVKERGRIYLNTDYEVEDILKTIMGIKSFSRVHSFNFTNTEEISNEAEKFFSGRVKGKVFGVYTKRHGDHEFSSIELDKMIGDRLFKYSKGVDLKNPEVRVEIEIRGNVAYFFENRISGPGGLPLGTEGKYIALVSGGIDSPVAVWMMARRGSPVDLIFCSLSPPYDVKNFLEVSEKLIEKWFHGYDPTIYIIDLSRLIEDFVFKGKLKYGNVSFKKLLYNIGERIAKKSDAYGIITGESSGQVSSQTPENIFQLSKGMNYPVIRPLIGFDKDEIIDLSRKIETYNENDLGEFCALFSERPITKIKDEELKQDLLILDGYIIEENEITILKGKEIKNYLKNIKIKNDKEIKVNEGSLIIDLRDPLSFKDWHIDNAINLSPLNFNKILEVSRNAKKVYLYCKNGLQSAYIAGKLNSMGIAASYLSLDKINKKIISK